jgi:MbtH protein
LDSSDPDAMTYNVVVNHEEQFSIWPVGRPTPRGWWDAGRTGTRAECLAYVEQVWADMRPLSLRKRMEQTVSAGRKQEES